MDEVALEEGRIALYQLERQLKTSNNNDNSENSVGSRQLSWNPERRMLDQMPRDTRLHNRKGSPLGLTVEELDDRGLLDGGGSIPSYYASFKQRNRRPLELKKRSSRLEEREQDESSKLAKNLFHMVHVIIKKGFNLDDLCRQRDSERSGDVSKAYFMYLIKKLGLPFAPRDIADIIQRFNVPNSTNMSYEDFFRCCGIDRNQDGDIDSDSIPRSLDINDYYSVVESIKKMLIECMTTLGKGIDDMYRTFARWDTEGSGAITATQFLRVLTALRVDLSEEEQDFVIELLDTNGMGKIDFESLLTYCFADIFPELNSPTGVTIRSLCLNNDNLGNIQNDSLSAVSIDGGNASVPEQRSVNSGPNRRPFTASLSHVRAVERNAAEFGPVAVDDSPVGVGVNHLRAMRTSRQRPVTASGRVSASSYDNQVKPTSRTYRDTDAIDYEDDGVDDGMDERGLYLSIKTPFQAQQADLVEHQDIASFNDNTLITEQDDYIFGSPHSTPANQTSMHGFVGYGNKINGHQKIFTADQPQNGPYFSQQSHRGRFLRPSMEANYYNYPDTMLGEQFAPASSNESSASEPRDHLMLLATQILSTLREMILSRYRNGKSLHEIFRHFDRVGKGYFDINDFIKGARDLRIEVSERVAEIAIKGVAIDGIDKVSFGEFKVFVLDIEHKALEVNVQQQLSHRFEKHGRDFKNWLHEIFFIEEGERFGSHAHTRALQLESVSTKTFVATLEKIGAKLSGSDIDRLVARFDVDGVGHVSIARFLKFIECGQAWAHAELVLAYQEESISEANIVRQKIKDGASNVNMTAELLSMAEYLGIRSITEKHMLWIAADALKAPLPVNWTVEKDEHGRTFFYNHITKQSRWDHPLDPHFRKLRDKYRQSEKEIGTPGSAQQGIGYDEFNPPPFSHLSVPRPQPELTRNMPALGNHMKKSDVGPISLLNPSSRVSSNRNSTEYHATRHSEGNDGVRSAPTSSPKLQAIIDFVRSDGAAHDRSNPLMDQYISQGNNSGGDVLRIPHVSNATVQAYTGSSSLKKKYSNVKQNRPVSSSGTRPLATPGNGLKARPESAKRPTSAVDRVINYGKEIPGYLQPKTSGKKDVTSSGKIGIEDPKLVKMYEDGLLGNLDNYLLPQAAISR